MAKFEIAAAFPREKRTPAEAYLRIVLSIFDTMLDKSGDEQAWVIWGDIAASLPQSKRGTNTLGFKNVIRGVLPC